MPVTTETPNTVHGRLLEAVHISGYTFERAYAELEWLLDEDRWKSVGAGYADIDAFLATIDFSEFRTAIDQRKKLAKRLAELHAQQQATARLLGVSEQTVARALGKPRGAPNGGKNRSNATKQPDVETTPNKQPPNGGRPSFTVPAADVTAAVSRVVRNETREADRQQRHADKVAAIKRRDAESEVVRYFMSAEPTQAVLVFRMVRGILEHRGAFAQSQAGTPKAVRRPAKRAEFVTGLGVGRDVTNG